MKNKKTLSIAPYYGGKGRMAHFIADRLDYDNTDIFVTPFGGMCRELLNKPRHKLECYNDYNSGLCALMRVLSDPEESSRFIHRLYNETEFSEAEFLKQKSIYDNAEIDLDQQEREKLRKLLMKHKIITPYSSNKFLDVMLSDIYNGKLIKEVSKGIQNYRIALRDKLEADPSFKAAFQSQLKQWITVYQAKLNQGFLPRTVDLGEDVSDIDLAIATYVTFKMSQNGMGKAFSKEKFKSNSQYLESVLSLYDCAERLEGIQVFQIDALEFFRRWNRVQHNTSEQTLGEWLDNPRVMIYCDPSYISPEDERKLLDGIDIATTDSLSEAVRKKYEGKKFPKNLGKIYSCSFGYEDQEYFLRCIQNAKARIMVSNYDLELYNKYLNPSTGWRREEFITFTAIGGKTDNTRVEVIWRNY